MDELAAWAERTATGQVREWTELQDTTLHDAFNRAYAEVFGSVPTDKVGIARAGGAFASASQAAP